MYFVNYINILYFQFAENVLQHLVIYCTNMFLYPTGIFGHLENLTFLTFYFLFFKKLNFFEKFFNHKNFLDNKTFFSHLTNCVLFLTHDSNLRKPTYHSLTIILLIKVFTSDITCLTLFLPSSTKPGCLEVPWRQTPEAWRCLGIWFLRNNGNGWSGRKNSISVHAYSNPIPPFLNKKNWCLFVV